jgi:hypothetical protein
VFCWDESVLRSAPLGRLGRGVVEGAGETIAHDLTSFN